MPPSGRVSVADHVAQYLKQELDERTYAQRIEGKTDFLVEGETLVISMSSPLVLDWLRVRYSDFLRRVSQELLGPDAGVEYRLRAQQAATRNETEEGASVEPMAPRMASVPHVRESAPASPPVGRRGHLTFDDFVLGESNRLAQIAACQVAEAPGERLNPLFLYGGVGIGKTHLLESIVREIRLKFPALQVLFVTAENFLNYFTEALRGHSLPSFRQKFRRVDVLVIDDVEFLEGKPACLEEFLNTIKMLDSDGRQLVLSADRHPRLLNGLGEELVSRCMAGMVCRIEAPERSLRRALIQRFADRCRLSLSNDIIDYLAGRFTKNVRELQGVIKSLHTYALMTGEELTFRTVRRLAVQLEGAAPRVVNISEIEQAVCNVFHVSAQSLKSNTRKQAVCHARHMAVYLARRLTGAAYSEIGSHFGNRNHSTVITSEKKIRSMIERQQTIELAGGAWMVEHLVDALEQQIRAG